MSMPHMSVQIRPRCDSDPSIALTGYGRRPVGDSAAGGAGDGARRPRQRVAQRREGLGPAWSLHALQCAGAPASAAFSAWHSNNAHLAANMQVCMPLMGSCYPQGAPLHLKGHRGRCCLLAACSQGACSLLAAC